MPEPVLNLLHLEEDTVTATVIKEATKNDPVQSRVLQYVLRRWPEKNAADEMSADTNCLRANGRTTPGTSWCFTHEESDEKLCVVAINGFRSRS